VEKILIRLYLFIKKIKNIILIRDDYFWFGLVFIKKITKLNLKKKTETEPKPVQTDRFRFGSVRFFRIKTGSNRFASVFSDFGSVFSQFGSFFPVWLDFGSVWFF